MEQEIVKDKGISKSSRLRNIRRNLEAERDYYRKESTESRGNYIIKDEEELELFENIADEWGDEYE